MFFILLSLEIAKNVPNFITKLNSNRNKLKNVSS
jgi:hypothetical protein